MKAIIQLIPLAEETLVEVSGVGPINGYFESCDVDVSVEGRPDAGEIKLSMEPQNKADFTACSFTMHIIYQRLILAHLANGSKMIVVSESVDDNLSDAQEIKESLKTNGGIWIDGLSKEHICEIAKYCSL